MKYSLGYYCVIEVLIKCPNLHDLIHPIFCPKFSSVGLLSSLKVFSFFSFPSMAAAAAAAAAMAAHSNGNGSALGTGSVNTHPGLVISNLNFSMG